MGQNFVEPNLFISEMGCELSKSAKSKAPKYRTVQSREVVVPQKSLDNFLVPDRRLSSVHSVSYKSEADSMLILPVSVPSVPSNMTPIVKSMPKFDPELEDIFDLEPSETPLPPDHELVIDDIPAEPFAVESVDKSMFDEEVLRALAMHETEHLLRKDFEFESILAQIQGA